MRITGLNLSPFCSYVKRFLFVCLLGGITGYAGAQSPVSGTFTINSAQPTAGNNFQTFTEAVFSLAYGVNGPVVFNVAPNSGPYNEQININAVAGTSATNTITFNGNGVTLTNASTNSLARAVVKLDGARHIIFDSLKVLPVINPTDVLTYGWGFGIVRDADSNIIRKCTVTVGIVALTGQNTIGIYVGSTDDYPSSNGVSYCDGNIITQNTINGGYYGIVVDSYNGNFSSVFTPMVNNQVTNNVVSNFVYTGISLGWNSNTLVQGNDISGPIPGGASGINIDTKSTKLKITGNRIHNIYSTSTSGADFAGISVAECPADDAASANTIANNLVYDIRTPNTQYGIHVSISSTFLNVYHNTFLLDTAGAASSSVTAGLYDEGDNPNLNFENNIVRVLRTGSGSRYGIYASSSTNTAFVCDYNDITVDPSNSFGRNKSTNYATLATWQTGTSRDAHSTSQDPVFTSVATGNLKPTSAAIDNLGTFVNINTDVNGDIRNNNTPDIGAYEFLTPPCNTPVTAGSSIAIPVSGICSGGNITLNLSGNSFGTGQTYQWQSAATATGTYTNVSGSQVIPSYDINPTTSLYYRALVTCVAGSNTSAPILITAKQPLSGNAYTINSTLATGGNNFQTFADALTALKCGVSGPVVLNVAPGSGPYNEQVIITEIAGASATNTITIKGNGTTLSFLATITGEREVLKLNGADYITIDSLNITALGTGATGQYGYGIHILNDANHNVISNCTVNINTTTTSSSYAGIVISGSATDALSGASYCDSNKIINNTVIGGYYGIIMFSDASVAMMYNDTIANNIVKDVYSYPIYLYGNDHSLVQGNDVSRPARTTTANPCNAIYLNNINTGVVVTKNKIHNMYDGIPTNTNAFNGIYSNNADATAAAPNVISNNVLYNMNGAGAQTGLYNSNSDYNLYYHNTISFDNTTGSTPTATARGIYQTAAATGLEYKNNLVSIKRNGTGTNHAIYMNTSTTTYVADYNDYYVAGSGNDNIGYSGSSYSTVAGWTAATTQDAHTVAVNPAFTDVTTGNLAPTTAGLDNKGTFVGITTDINNTTRSTGTPDIGAYEFSATLPVTLTGIAAVKSAADVIVSWATATEINTKVFEIERSADGINFSLAGTEDAKGNSTTPESYAFTDQGAAASAASGILYYRLRIVDNNGNFDYSPVVTVSLGNNAQVVKVFPNPVVSELYASIVTGMAGNASVDLTDVAGRKILHQEQRVAQGSNTISINGIDRLEKGVYFVTISINNNKYVFRIVK